MSTVRWFLVTLLIIVGLFVAASIASAFPEEWRVDSRRPSGAEFSQDADDVTWWRVDSRRPARFPQGTSIGDLDGDGVLDPEDACPETPFGAAVDTQGCPADSDGDGVFDGLDRCADTRRGVFVDVSGCALDGDNDGIPDGIDQCPDSKAGTEVDEMGCRILSEKESELLDTGKLTLQNVKFEVNQAVLKPESQAVLDEVGTILVDWSKLRLEVGGHTDNTGNADYNRSLSERRARAVREYLLQRFTSIQSTQLTARGYGEESAVATNNTMEGRARNRRVEFTVLNKETLRK